MRWRVWVKDGHGAVMSFECRHLVLATGASDRAGCLGVPGESLPFVTHDLRTLEDRLIAHRDILPSQELPGSSKAWTPRREKVLVKTRSNNSLLTGELQPVEHILRSSDNITRHTDLDLDLSRKRLHELPIKYSRSKSHVDHCENISELFDNLERIQRLENGEDHSWLQDGVSVDVREKPRNLSLSELRDTEKDMHRNSVLRHSLHELSLLSRVSRERPQKERLPVLVVGAGLSAADAILTARREGRPVVHAFRRTPVPTPLPAVLYPEYNEVYQLMQGQLTSPEYRALAGYQVTAFNEDSTVLLTDFDGNKLTLKIFTAAVLIGSQPDLSFLPKKLRNLGVDVNKPVDCKVNPMYIDPYSYRCLRAPPGLYALGPLVGDNFVRFLQGGAVAIASHIYKDTKLNHCP